ncbi:MAG: hypothetical protein HQL20_00120 [Candidatus Omnitrophica bacterium]|nr:hypothetical protein [Candidatus Omnitrophota bacterium]
MMRLPVFNLARAVPASLVLALIDLVVFILAYRSFKEVSLSLVASRACSMSINYVFIKKAVYFSGRKNYWVFGKYLLSVIFFSLVSYAGMVLLMEQLAVSVVAAKLMVETVLFTLTFLVQRDLVFVTDGARQKTDWDRYYQKPYQAARFSRRITQKHILGKIRKYAPKDPSGLAIIELGGANSCFIDSILKAIRPREYHVVDNNAVGLLKLKERTAGLSNVFLYHQDVLTFQAPKKLDLAFSTGLIEHFSAKDVERVVKAHFSAVKPGGVVLLTFPRATWLYQLTRFWAVLFRLWIFTDEKPLDKEEILSLLSEQGEILYATTIWPIFLTQMLVVIRKTAYDAEV